LSRTGASQRVTGETDVQVRVNLDGSGTADVSTGVGFFDHMLTLMAHHALIDLEITARGDLDTGSHHTVEDVGITLGQALDTALGDRTGIERYGAALVPMDECLGQAAIDVSGRPFLVCDVPLPYANIGGFETDLLEEFLRGLSSNARLTIHLRMLSGSNPHHVIECGFKAFARALRAAIAPNPRVTGIPSTKGSL
jgi:imidazoleglycerol-phosphate dehydratase